jgi:asparagine N-glycosylation enzyme membrane subunit Stt3
MGLLFGLMIAFIGHRLIFGIDLTYLIIYPVLFYVKTKPLKIK